MSSRTPPAGNPERLNPHTPQIDGPVILPPGEDPLDERRGPIDRLVVEQVRKRAVVFEHKPPKESLYAKVSPDHVVTLPFAPFNASGNSEEPLFALHNISSAKRRLLGNPWDTLSLSQLGKTARLMLTPETTVDKATHLLVGVPTDGETVSLSFGTAANNEPRPCVSLKKTPHGYEITGSGGNSEVSAEPVFVGTRMRDAVVTKKMTEEARGKIIAEEVSFNEEKMCCGIRIVTVLGSEYLLIEGLEETAVHVPDSLLARTKEKQLQLVNTEHIAKSGAAVSIANPEHPFRNEDSVTLTKSGTGIVADGMGGYDSGFYVSRLVTDVIGQIDDAYGVSQDPKSVQEMFVKGLQKAHDVLKQIPTEGDTTVAVARVVKDKHGKRFGVWANVGDARVYVCNPMAGPDKKILTQLSTDDNILRRWERRAKENNGWITLKEGDPSLQQFKDFGFKTDGISHVFLEPWKMDILRGILDSVQDFTVFSEQTLPLSAYDFRNISDGLRNGPGADKPAEYHSGVRELPEGAVLVLVSDGSSDTLADVDLGSALLAGTTPLQKAQTVVQRVHERFAEHKNALSKIPETQADPMELQRVKEDDISVIILQ